MWEVRFRVVAAAQPVTALLVARGSALSFATRSTDPAKQANKKSAELRLQERVSLPIRQNGQNHQNAKLRRLILGGIKTDFQRPKAHWSDGQNHLDHSNHCYCQRCPMEPHVVAKFLSRILVQNSGELQPDVSLMLGDDATHECQH